MTTRAYELVERVKSYETASRDKSKAMLTVREKSYGKRIPMPAILACVRTVLPFVPVLRP